MLLADAVHASSCGLSCRHEGDIPAALQQYERLSSKRAADLLAYSRQAAASRCQTAELQHLLSHSVIRDATSAFHTPQQSLRLEPVCWLGVTL